MKDVISISNHDHEGKKDRETNIEEDLDVFDVLLFRVDEFKDDFLSFSLRGRKRRENFCWHNVDKTTISLSCLSEIDVFCLLLHVFVLRFGDRLRSANHPIKMKT